MLEMMAKLKCAVCGKSAYWIPTKAGPAPLCPTCLEDISHFLTAIKKKEEWDAKKLFRRALVENVRARGRVYASSLAWRLGLTRREAWREVTDMARTRGWRVVRTPSNHILVISSRGARKLEKAAAPQPT